MTERDHAAPSGRPLLLPPERHLAAALPASTDVLVMGGGLAGCALAYYLARAGVEVVVVERGELNREASGTNAGSFHFQIAIHQLSGASTDEDHERLLLDVRLHAAAAEVWYELEAELDADLGVHQTGGLMIAETPEQFAVIRDKHVIEREAGLDTDVLSARELRAAAPYLADDLAGGSFCAREGHANPLLAAPAFAARAIEAGARLATHAAVLGIEQLDGTGAARFAVRTGRGTVRAARVVNAAGAWAADLAAMSGLALPVRAEGLHVNVTEPREHVLTPMVQHIGRRLTLKQNEAGTFIIGGGWPARPEPAPARYSVRWDSAAGNAAVAVRVMPMLAGVRVVHMWTGVMTFMDDLTPIIGEFERLPGYYMCLATTGFTLGPLVARRLAEAMTGAGATTLPAAYAPERVPSLPARAR